MSEEVYKGKRSLDYGSPAEQREWLKKGTQRRTRGELLRQFQKLESGTGNSEAFREGWERTFKGTETSTLRPVPPESTPWYACDACGMTREITRVVLDPIHGARRLCRKCEVSE